VRFIEITKVEQARELKARLYDSSVECDYKIYIIPDAHKMNLRAQNALLISLEEPPKNVIFFLLTTDAGALIETIRSRAQILRTKRLDDKTIFDYIKKNRRDITLSDDSLKEIVVASSGSLGYALDMADSKKSEAVLSQRSKAIDFTSAVLRDDNDAVSFLYALSSSARDELKELISLSLEVLGDVISLKKDINAPLYFFSSRDTASELSSKFNMSRVMGVYNALLTALDDLNANCQQALTLMSILTNSAKKGN
jgi:DNA polymerase III gamma/tau subunit